MSILAAALIVTGSAKPHPLPVTVSVGPIIEALHPVSLAAAPGGSLFAAAMEDGSVHIIDAKTRATVRTMLKHPQPAYAVAFSSDGRLLATGDETGRVWIENAFTGKAVRGYRRHAKGVEKLSFNAFDNLLVSTGKDDQVNVYNLSSPDKKEALAIAGKGEDFYGATFNPQSSRIFSVGMLGGGIRAYDAINGHVLYFFADPNGQGIYDLSYNPNGSREVSGGRNGEAVIWEANSGKKVASLKGHQDWVMATAISPNGQLAATSSTDGTVKVWDLHTYSKVADLPEQFSVGSPLCFTADGTTLVSVSSMGSLEFNPVTPPQNFTGAVLHPTRGRLGVHLASGTTKHKWHRKAE